MCSTSSPRDSVAVLEDPRLPPPCWTNEELSKRRSPSWSEVVILTANLLLPSLAQADSGDREVEILQSPDVELARNTFIAYTLSPPSQSRWSFSKLSLPNAQPLRCSAMCIGTTATYRAAARWQVLEESGLTLRSFGQTTF